jgi:uncharacterized membrane protein YphA (DoxX/SURF4 family)
MTPARLISWIASLGVAGLFAFTGLYKLTGSPDAQATFAKIGGDPDMYFTGLVEIVGAVLILLPKTRAVGGVFAMGVMGGAIASHLANLVPNHDMLPLAVVLFTAAGVVAYLHRRELPILGRALPAAAIGAEA